MHSFPGHFRGLELYLLHCREHQFLNHLYFFRDFEDVVVIIVQGTLGFEQTIDLSIKMAGYLAEAISKREGFQLVLEVCSSMVHELSLKQKWTLFQFRRFS